MIYQFLDLKKAIKHKKKGLPKLKVALLGDNATQFLANALEGQAAISGWDFNLYEADYNQIEGQILNMNSYLYQFDPDYVIISISSFKLRKTFYSSTTKAKCQFSEKKTSQIWDLYSAIIENSSAKVILFNFPEIPDQVFGNFSLKVSESFIYQLKELNFLLIKESYKFKNLFLLDVSSLQNRIGYDNTFDSKMYINADVIYNFNFIPHISKNIIDIIESIEGKFKKCLIIDLDNTLWGGVIGDDGIEKIEIGDLGIGKAFYNFQLWIKQLKNRGIILAICSKNTESIAKEPFEKHPEMVLSLDDIAVFVANWETKVDNIRYIQSILNIGFDSMVFVDDNPFERNIVKTNIPEITVPELPEDPAEYLDYIIHLNLFETASSIKNDFDRTKQYQEEASRSSVSKSFMNETDFLSSLEMKSSILPFDKFSVPRVSQLSQRSNQANLRTIRYTEAEIEQIIESDNYITYSVSLEDKFGDYGLISVVILQIMDNRTVFIDNWIMSCRVLKRGVERFIMNEIITDLILRRKIKLYAEYLPTKKNVIVKDLYSSLGFLNYCDNLNKWKLDIEVYSAEKTQIRRKK